MKTDAKVLIVAAIACVAAPPAGSQRFPSAALRVAGQCVPARVDTAAGFVYGSLVAEKPGDAVDRERLTSALVRLSAALMDDTLTLQPVSRLFDVVVSAVGARAAARPRLVPQWPGHPALATEIAITLDASGAITEPRVLVRGDSAVAATLVRAIGKGAATADASRSGRPERLRLRLSLRPDSAAVSAPLVAARQLSIEGTPPRQHPGLGAPIYPRGGSEGRWLATVLAWYVVDASGSAIPASFGAAPVADRARAG